MSKNCYIRILNSSKVLSMLVKRSKKSWSTQQYIWLSKNWIVERATITGNSAWKWPWSTKTYAHDWRLSWRRCYEWARKETQRPEGIRKNLPDGQAMCIRPCSIGIKCERSVAKCAKDIRRQGTVKKINLITYTYWNKVTEFQKYGIVPKWNNVGFTKISWHGCITRWWVHCSHCIMLSGFAEDYNPMVMALESAYVRPVIL